MNIFNFSSKFKSPSDTQVTYRPWEFKVSLFEQKVQPVPLIACYASSEVSEHQNNPFIEALPRVMSREEWIDFLTAVPVHSELDSTVPTHVRLQMVNRLKDVFIPLSYQTDLATRLDSFIRDGYVHRKPSVSRELELQKNYIARQKGENVKCPEFGKSAPISSMSVFGMSGMGKTTIVEKALSAHPQWLYHPAINQSQIVWLKAECPRDGSVRELALGILRCFDNVLGTSHSAQHESGVSEYSIFSKIQLLCRQNNLGLLVIDELQNLCVKKSGGREEMLNFFQGLINELRIPVLFLGTHKAQTLMLDDVRHSRRIALKGSVKLKNLPNDSFFAMLVTELWKYLYVHHVSALTLEMIDVIYEETQGVVAFVVDMFLVAQIHALRGKGSPISPELFRHVARTEFECLQGFLNALRSKDPRRIKKYQDAISYDIRDMLDEDERFVPAAYSGSSAPIMDSSSTFVTKACEVLMSSLDLSEEEARELVALVSTGKEASYQAIVKAATQAYYEAK